MQLVERTFSDLKHIKNRLHNRLLSTSLSKLMTTAIEDPPLAKVDFDAVLTLWESMKPRRILLLLKRENKQTYIQYIIL